MSLESYPMPLVTVIRPEVTLILLCSYTCVPLFVCSAYLIWYHHLRDEAARDPYGQKRKQTTGRIFRPWNGSMDNGTYDQPWQPDIYQGPTCWEADANSSKFLMTSSCAL